MFVAATCHGDTPALNSDLAPFIGAMVRRRMGLPAQTMPRLAHSFGTMAIHLRLRFATRREELHIWQSHHHGSDGRQDASCMNTSMASSRADAAAKAVR